MAKESMRFPLSRDQLLKYGGAAAGSAAGIGLSLTSEIFAVPGAEMPTFSFLGAIAGGVAGTALNSLIENASKFRIGMLAPSKNTTEFFMLSYKLVGFPSVLIGLSGIGFRLVDLPFGDQVMGYSLYGLTLPYLISSVDYVKDVKRNWNTQRIR